jgi:hypothetical protein
VHHAISDVGDELLGQGVRSSTAGSLQRHLETMKSYLDHFQQEAEQHAHTLDADIGVDLKTLDDLRRFAIGKHHPGGGSSFELFSTAYHEARGLLLQRRVDIETARPDPASGDAGPTSDKRVR